MRCVGFANGIGGFVPRIHHAGHRG